MAFLPAGRALLLACFVALPLAACVAGSADTASGRASTLATTVSRAVACKAGSPQRTTLDRFLADPPGEVPGTTMTYAGVADARDRKDLIDYLARAGRSAECGRPQ